MAPAVWVKVAQGGDSTPTKAEVRSVKMRVGDRKRTKVYGACCPCTVLEDPTKLGVPGKQRVKGSFVIAVASKCIRHKKT
jgi:hypothetical protein